MDISKALDKSHMFWLWTNWMPTMYPQPCVTSSSVIWKTGGSAGFQKRMDNYQPRGITRLGTGPHIIQHNYQSGVNLQIVCTIKIELFTCYLELWWQKKQHRIWKTTRKGTTFFSIMYLQFRTSWIAFPAVTLHAIIVAIKLQFFFVVGTKQFPANQMSNTSISIFCQLCIKLSATHMSI